jgi:hypothetical protein
VDYFVQSRSALAGQSVYKSPALHRGSTGRLDRPEIRSGH